MSIQAFVNLYLMVYNIEMNIPVEYFGTAASVIVAVSLTQKNIKRLRVLNFIGAAAFAGYGLMINSWPVFGMNAFIGIIDIYYLAGMSRRDSFFECLRIENPKDSAYLKKFIEFYLEDITKFMPNFSGVLTEESEAVFVLRDMMPVSLVIYRREGNRVVVSVDYAIAAYRDMKNSQFFFNHSVEEFFGEDTQIFAEKGSIIHNKYLEKMGFSFSEKDQLYKRT